MRRRKLDLCQRYYLSAQGRHWPLTPFSPLLRFASVSDASPETALECRNLWKVFGNGAERILAEHLATANTSSSHSTSSTSNGTAELADRIRAGGGIVACDSVDLRIDKGEFFVLMGLSGSGKSTLVRCLSRLIDPSAGVLELDGEDFLNIPPKQLRSIRRRKLGMVFQHFGLFPHMSVIDNVAYPLRVQRVSKAERQRKAAEMVELVGLEGREDAYPHQLSGGQKQRVGIARSLAVDPQLWFLDEPFSALDPLIRAQMQAELQQLQQRFKKTIVFVTHDFMEAVKLAGRIAIMKDGAVQQIGTPQEIVLNPATEYVAEFVREAPRTRIIQVDQLMQNVGESGITPGQRPALTASMTLEQVLTTHAQSGDNWPVQDDDGNLVGVVTPERLASALAGVEEPR